MNDNVEKDNTYCNILLGEFIRKTKNKMSENVILLANVINMIKYKPIV